MNNSIMISTRLDTWWGLTI